MASKPSQRTIGAVFSPADEHEYAVAADPRANYDVLVFVERTTAARGRSTAHRAGAGVELGVVATKSRPTSRWRAAATSRTAGARPGTASTHIWCGRGRGVASRRTSGTARARRSDATLGRRGAHPKLLRCPLARPAPGIQRRHARRGAAHRNRRSADRQRLAEAKEGQDAPVSKPILALQSDGAVRATDWTRRSVAVDIPADADRIQISLVVTGAAPAGSATSSSTLAIPRAGEHVPARAIGGSSRTSACQIRWPVPRFKTHRARWRFFSASGYKPGKARSWWRTPTVRVWTKATAVSIQMGK